MIAAEMTGRVCYGIELNPAYVDVIVRRWQLLYRPGCNPSSLRQSFDERAGRLDDDQFGAAMARQHLR